MRDRNRARVRLPGARSLGLHMGATERRIADIAHDLNNVLIVITGYAFLLQKSVKDPKNRADIAQIRDAVERAGELVQKLLAIGSEATRPGARYGRLDR